MGKRTLIEKGLALDGNDLQHRKMRGLAGIATYKCAIHPETFMHLHRSEREVSHDWVYYLWCPDCQEGLNE